MYTTLGSFLQLAKVGEYARQSLCEGVLSWIVVGRSDTPMGPAWLTPYPTH